MDMASFLGAVSVYNNFQVLSFIVTYVAIVVALFALYKQKSLLGFIGGLIPWVGLIFMMVLRFLREG